MRKIKSFYLLLILVLFVLVFVYKLVIVNEHTKPDEIEVNDMIVDYSEKNIEVVEEYFTDGMKVEDYVKTIDKTAMFIREQGKYKRQNYNFERHLKYSELEDIYLELNNSRIVELENIGISVDGRNIYSISIGLGNKKIMFEAGIHAAEIANPLFVTKFIIDLVNDYEDNKEYAIKLLNKYKIIVLPVVNPDGYDTALFGPEILNNKELFTYKNKDLIDFNYFKGNANGVDINRNMPSQNAGLYYKKYNLIGTVSLEPSTKRLSYFGGYSLGSEPETKALMYWQYKYHNEIYAYVALHSAGRIIYNVKPNLSNEFNDLSKKYALIINEVTGYTVLDENAEEVGEGNDGTATDFIAELVNGFKFSSKTGRLTHKYYAKKINDIKYKVGVINIESLEKFTFDLKTIKNEYISYNLKEAYLNLINQ